MAVWSATPLGRHTFLLSAEGSQDDGRIATTAWQVPGAILHGPTVAYRFPPAVEHQVQLTVTDDYWASDSISFTLPDDTPHDGTNQPPIPIPDIRAEGTLLHLNASRSLDPEGDDFSVFWEVDGHHAGNGTLVKHRVALAGIHEVRLLVRDLYGAQANVSVPVHLRGQDTPIIALQRIDMANGTLLDASGSRDTANRSLSYAWSLDGQPVGNATTLLVPHRLGNVTVRLSVANSDGHQNITAIQFGAWPQQTHEVPVGAAQPSLPAIGVVALLGVFALMAARRRMLHHR